MFKLNGKALNYESFYFVFLGSNLFAIFAFLVLPIIIWIRDFEQIKYFPKKANCYGSSFYNIAKGDNIKGSIADNQLWKTINSGKNAFTNVSNVYNNGENLIQFYHAAFAFNFNPGNYWNTDLNETASEGYNDLYAYALREVVHALGFISLINNEGNSKFGKENKFYSRFDTFLVSQSGQNLITAGKCSPMHDVEFVANVSDLSLNCNVTLPENQVDCNNSIQFMGTNTTLIFTPNCFNDFSLNLISGSCNDPDLFLMSNADVITVRNLTVEERAILNDIGYSFNSTYANTNDFYFKDYNSQLLTESVVGINDGLDNNEIVFYDEIDNSITITNLLNNDFGNNLEFECLKDVTYNSTIFSANSGDSSTIVELSSTISGLHILSYIPYNSATGKRGNITYVYLYLLAVCTDNNPDICSFVSNGDFEDNFVDFFTQLPIEPLSPGDVYPACSWSNFGSSSADYFYENTGSDLNVPNNFFGNETDLIIGNKAYAGIYATRGGGNEVIMNRLNNNLQQNINYTLTFTVSKADNVVNNSDLRFQAYITNTSPIAFGSSINASTGNYNISPTNGILLTSPVFSNTTNGWETITLNFNSSNILNLRNLYIGKINETATPLLMPNTAQSQSYFYIDNVRLIETPPVTPVLSLPSPLCTTDTVLDLNTYLTNGVTGGFFSIDGTPITGSTFNPATVGVGSHTITYTIPNTIACTEIVVLGTIVVNPCVATPPYISQVYAFGLSKFIEVKNADDTAAIVPGTYYLAMYEGLDPLTNAPSSFIDLSAIPAQGTKVFKSQSASAPGYALSNPTWMGLNSFDGINDIVIITTTTDATAYANRVDIAGDNTSWCKKTSIVRVSCMPLEHQPPRTDAFDEQDWVGFSISEVDNDFNKKNSILGRHYNDPLTWTFSGWDDASPTESNPDRSRTVRLISDYTTSFAAGTNQPSFEACSLTVETGTDLIITPSTYTKVQTSVTVTDANAKLIINDKGSLVMVRDIYYGVEGADLVNLGTNSTMSIDRTSVGVNGPHDYVFWSSPLSNSTTNATADQIFNFTGVNTQPAPYNHQFDPFRFYLFENKNFYDKLNIYGDNGNGTDGYDDNYNDVFDPLVDDYVPFTALPSAVNQQLIPGRGYNTWPPIGTPANIPSSYTIKFKGEMNNGIVTVPVFANDSEFGLDPNLVGNPYPSPIDLKTFLFENSEIIKPYALIWGRQGLDANGNPIDVNDNPNNNNSGFYALNYNEDNYMVYNPYMSLLPNSFTNNLAFNEQGLLASCQSFFVFTKDVEPIGNEDPIYNTGTITEVGTVNFSNKMRSTLPNITFARTSNLSGGDKLWVNLTDTNNYSAQLGICFNELASANYSIDEDVQTTQGRKYNFYTQSTTEDLIIDIQDAFTDDKEIPLGILNNSDNQNQSFTISIPQKSGIFNIENIYLEDLQLNIVHNLSQSGYSFTTAGTIIENRFKLRFTNNNTNLARKSLDNQVQISLNENEVVVTSNVKKIKHIEVSDIYVVNSSGFTVVVKENINANTTSFTIDKKHKLLNFKITLEDGTIINKKMAR